MNSNGNSKKLFSLAGHWTITTKICVEITDFELKLMSIFMSHAEKKIAIVTWCTISNPHLLYFMDFLSVEMEMYSTSIYLQRNDGIVVHQNKLYENEWKIRNWDVRLRNLQIYKLTKIFCRLVKSLFSSISIKMSYSIT